MPRPGAILASKGEPETAPPLAADETRSDPRASHRKPSDVLEEVRDMLIAYFRQEALVPLRKLLAWLGWGILGALFLSVGVVLLGLAALRALQLVDTFDGNLSWVPYAIVLAGMAVILLFSLKAARARRKSRNGEGK